jgi:hypothetical protein
MNQLALGKEAAHQNARNLRADLSLTERRGAAGQFDFQRNFRQADHGKAHLWRFLSRCGSPEHADSASARPAASTTGRPVKGAM